MCAVVRERGGGRAVAAVAGTPFARFTGTKVQILTQQLRLLQVEAAEAQVGRLEMKCAMLSSQNRALAESVSTTEQCLLEVSRMLTFSHVCSRMLIGQTSSRHIPLAGRPLPPKLSNRYIIHGMCNTSNTHHTNSTCDIRMLTYVDV